MNRSTAENLPAAADAAGNTCLSCGTRENMAGRRYCSVYCRQRLRYKLGLRTGLLRALNTRYAAFSFTDRVITLDVLPFGDRRIFSYIYPRGDGRSPAEDFSRMADLLGNFWWEERRRTQKKYLATQSLLDRAEHGRCGIAEVVPIEIGIPSINGSSLIHLQLGRNQLQSAQLKEVIRNAYRLQAKKHHPDLGGSADMFRKIQSAYEELLKWAETPSFVRRRGFPDKWFYDGDSNRWVQPTPVR